MSERGSYRAPIGHDFFEAPGWKLRRPTSDYCGKTIFVPTVHPYGDQRILRCAQSLLDAGYGIHLIWMGGEHGESSWGERLAETRLPFANSTLDRIRALPRIARLASKKEAAAWHIHDYYMLPMALLRAAIARRPAIYDVHEYYADLYAAKLPERLRPLGARLINGFQAWGAAQLGGANVVAPELAHIFESAGAIVCVTPNYPLSELFQPYRRALTSDLLLKAIHSGSLTDSYGSRLLVDLAAHLDSIGSKVVIDAIARFPSAVAEREFRDYLAARGSPKSIRLIDPVPAHALPELLSNYGIGISAIQDYGQNSIAVATKLYEYASIGLAIVASDLEAQRSFVQKQAFGVLVPASDTGAYSRAFDFLSDNPNSTIRGVDSVSLRAAMDLSWEAKASPQLQSMVRELMGD